MITAKEINEMFESASQYSKLLDKYDKDENSVTFIQPESGREPIRFFIKFDGENIIALNQSGQQEKWMLDDGSRKRGFTGQLRGSKSNNKTYYFDGLV